jgi:hypothetical protein
MRHQAFSDLRIPTKKLIRTLRLYLLRDYRCECEDFQENPSNNTILPNPIGGLQHASNIRRLILACRIGDPLFYSVMTILLYPGNDKMKYISLDLHNEDYDDDVLSARLGEMTNFVEGKLDAMLVGGLEKWRPKQQSLFRLVTYVHREWTG